MDKDCAIFFKRAIFRGKIILEDHFFHSSVAVTDIKNPRKVSESKLKIDCENGDQIHTIFALYQRKMAFEIESAFENQNLEQKAEAEVDYGKDCQKCIYVNIPNTSVDGNIQLNYFYVK